MKESIFELLNQKVDYERYFYLCKASFQKCISISLKEADFVIDELREMNCPVDSIRMENDSVSIKFNIGNISYYSIEVKINLVDISGDEIGNYRYIEDDLGNQIDDYLIFHPR